MQLSHHSILLAIHPLSYQGKGALGEKWGALLADLRSLLAEKATPAPADGELLLFHFSLLQNACTSLLEILARLKEAFGWGQDLGPLPLQIILHLEREGDLPGPVHEAGSDLWDLLVPEQIHVTRPLKLQWDQLKGTGTGLPPHSFEDGDKGLARLSFLETLTPPQAELFPHRAMPLAGHLKPCFYCGMTKHKPAACPSKFLTMGTRGMEWAGYQTVKNLSSLFARAMSSQEKLDGLLAASPTGAQIRQHALLHTYLAYFDLNLTYQSRFLLQIAFSPFAKWEDLRRPDTLSIDNQTLNLALDCLRVGEYAQAEALFVDEGRRPKGRQFCAAIGRAFVALELGRDSDMGHFLESAVDLAGFEKEKIYIALLLSRHYALTGDTWKAEHALNAVFRLRRDLDEALYCRVQMMARNGLGDTGFRQLRILVAESRDFFLSALIDPQLLPCAGEVDSILTARMEIASQKATEGLTQARDFCLELKGWFEEGQENAEMASCLLELGEIEKQYEAGSYFDHLDVAHRSRTLLTGCSRLQEKLLDELLKTLTGLLAAASGYQSYWKKYPYPTFFKEFGQTTLLCKNELQEIDALAGRGMHGQLYRSIQQKMGETAKRLNQLKAISIRMAWMKIFLDGAKLFGKRLLITEIVLLGSLLLLLPIVTSLTGSQPTMLESLHDPALQKQLLFILTLLVAPLLALAQAIWKMMDA